MYKTGFIKKDIMNIRKKQYLNTHYVSDFCNNGDKCYQFYKLNDSIKPKKIIIKNKKKCLHKIY